MKYMDWIQTFPITFVNKCLSMNLTKGSFVPKTEGPNKVMVLLNKIVTSFIFFSLVFLSFNKNPIRITKTSQNSTMKK